MIIHVFPKHIWTHLKNGNIVVDCVNVSDIVATYIVITPDGPHVGPMNFAIWV